MSVRSRAFPCKSNVLEVALHHTTARDRPLEFSVDVMFGVDAYYVKRGCRTILAGEGVPDAVCCHGRLGVAQLRDLAECRSTGI